MLSPNYVSGSQADSTKRKGDAHGSLFERKIIVKSPEPRNKALRKVEKLSAEINTENYQQKLLQKIMS